MNYEKDKNLTRFLLTFFLGWIGSIIINSTNLKPKGYKSRTLAYFFLTSITFGIYGLVAAISNLSFDPSKESNIGYAKEEGYVYNANSYQNDTIDYVIDNNQLQNNTCVTTNTVIQKVIVMIMAILSLLTLTFTLCKSGLAFTMYVENGFTFLAFKSILISSYFSWAIYLIGAFSILFLLVSLILITLSIFNFFIKKRFNLIIIVASIVIAVLYMIIGIVFVIVCNVTYGYDYYFRTFAYIPLILQIILLVAYIICGKIKTFSKEITQDKTQNNVSVSAILSRAMVEEQQINKYKEMLDNGIITEEEYNEKKRKILGL
ncbi:MAG: SHOCT domain-containing protein [Clostridia bacterium]|nr:SHOCT domain-containing protein [Clostridia bacterium]